MEEKNRKEFKEDEWVKVKKSNKCITRLSEEKEREKSTELELEEIFRTWINYDNSYKNNLKK